MFIIASRIYALVAKSLSTKVGDREGSLSTKVGDREGVKPNLVVKPSDQGLLQKEDSFILKEWYFWMNPTLIACLPCSANKFNQSDDKIKLVDFIKLSDSEKKLVCQ